MKTKRMHSLAALLAGAGMALGQGPDKPKSPPAAAAAAGGPAAVEAAPAPVAPFMAGSPYAGSSAPVTILGGAAAGKEAPATLAPACGPSGCPIDFGGDRGQYATGSRVWGGVEYL